MKSAAAPVVVFVEGGGNTELSRRALHEAFSAFLEKTALGIKRRPKMVASGSRTNAFDDFKIAKAQGKQALLLVDSEDPVRLESQTPANQPEQWRPWAHLMDRDAWERPDRAADSDCHLMTQCMESWLIADWTALQQYFGQGFLAKQRPKGMIEAIPKEAVLATLEKATKDCKTKGAYQKGRDSFKLLARIDPELVCAASPWAKRLVDELGRRKP